jgi:hypothetical protein
MLTSVLKKSAFAFAIAVAPAMAIALAPNAVAGQTAHFTQNDVPIYGTPASTNPAISYGCANTSCNYYWLTGTHTYCYYGNVVGQNTQVFQKIKDLSTGQVGYVILYSSSPAVVTNSPSYYCA